MNGIYNIWGLRGGVEVGEVEVGEREVHLYSHSNQEQNSVEIDQTAKGEWVVKSVKLYFGDEGAEVVRERLEALKAIAEESVEGREG